MIFLIFFCKMFTSIREKQETAISLIKKNNYYNNRKKKKRKKEKLGYCYTYLSRKKKILGYGETSELL